MIFQVFSGQYFNRRQKTFFMPVKHLMVYWPPDVSPPGKLASRDEFLSSHWS